MPKHYRPPGKKKEGTAARFITRTKAVHNLQVSLPLFRKLCILKGVFPREPKKKIEGSQKTYYHVKDINFLMHEPLRGKLLTRCSSPDPPPYEKLIVLAV